MAAAVGPLAMNVFLPSLPGMARYFDTDYAVMQLAVSLYLAATAVLQLFIGPASDRFGRRPVMLVCFAIFLVGTVAADLCADGRGAARLPPAAGLPVGRHCHLARRRARHGRDGGGGQPDRLHHHGHERRADGRPDDRRLPRRALRLAGELLADRSPSAWSRSAVVHASTSARPTATAPEASPRSSAPIRTARFAAASGAIR